MKRALTIVLALAFAISFIACEKAPFLTMTGPRSYTFTRDGGSQSFAFSCNRDWSVSSTESWIKVSPASGKASDGDITLTITCSPNTTYDARSATITVSLADLSESLTVTQDTGIGLIVSPTTVELTNAAQDIEIEVQKNVQYSVAIDESGVDWIKQGGTKSLSTDKVTFHIAANTSYDDRESKIAFKQIDGTLTQMVTVRQSQTNGLFITTSEYVLSNEAQTLGVEVKANVEFEATSQTDWIKFVETKALSPSTIVLDIAANESYDNRTGTVLVRQTNGSLSGTITITQKQTDGLFVTPKEFELSDQAQTISLKIKNNVPYSVVIPDDAKNWISVLSNTQTKSLADNEITLAISQNTSYDNRMSSITVKQTNGPLAETINILQAYAPGLIVDEKEVFVPVKGGTIEVSLKTNIEYDVLPDAEWIHYVETKALNQSSVLLSIDENPTNKRRIASVVFKQRNGALSESVTITQERVIVLYSYDGKEYPLPEAIDLGLPSGTLWASFPMGALDEYSYPLSINLFKRAHITDEYAGEGWNHWYFSGSFAFDISGTKDDIATSLGDGWQMPTISDFNELISNCTFESFIRNGDDYVRAISKINKNSIVLIDNFWNKQRSNQYPNIYWASTVYTKAKESTPGADPNKLYYYLPYFFFPPINWVYGFTSSEEFYDGEIPGTLYETYNRVVNEELAFVLPVFKPKK